MEKSQGYLGVRTARPRTSLVKLHLPNAGVQARSFGVGPLKIPPQIQKHKTAKHRSSVVTNSTQTLRKCAVLC